MSTRSYEVIVVGAGIVGAACAEACAREGLRVAVIDRDPVGSGATAAGMGHIVVMDDSEAQFDLTRYSQQLWQGLRGELPVDVEYTECGTIWVAVDEQELAEVKRKAAFYKERGVPVEVLSPTALERAEPNLRKGVAGGLLVPGDGVLYPPCAARFLVDRARERGADLFLGSAVVSIGKGSVRLAGDQILTAGTIVNAAGGGAAALTPGIDIKPRKGHLVITDRYPGYLRHQLVELGYLKSAHSLTGDSVAFNVQPRPTGQILIGSSRQYGSEYGEVDPSIVARMLRRAEEYMPGLGRLSAIRTWTGFRSATEDKVPLIGPAPGDPTVVLAAGHEGLGITMSLATARLIVDQLMGRPTAIPAGPYSPSRAVEEAVHA